MFHARVNENRVPDHLRFAFWNEIIKLRRKCVQNHEKKCLFQNLQRLLSCMLTSPEKPRSAALKRGIKKKILCERQCHNTCII